MQKIAMVTGAGSGIGRAVTLGLAQDSYIIIAVGRRFEALVETAGLAAPGTVIPISADIRRYESIAELFSRMEAEFGHLDLLFNNAGVSAVASRLDELSFEAWRNVIETNVTGTFLCTQGAFRLMKRQTHCGGRIINNGSVAIVAPRPRSIGSTASKHAILGLTKATALEGREFGIACGQIDIGNANTSMTEEFAVGTLQADGNILTEPTIDLEGIVGAVRYMASLPLSANVLNITVMATKMPLIGRG